MTTTLRKPQNISRHASGHAVPEPSAFVVATKPRAPSVSAATVEDLSPARFPGSPAYVVAWRVEYRESAVLAKDLIETSIAREGVEPTRLTIHADGGPSMTSKTLAYLFAELGVTKSRSRPHVSNDNPYSEAGFKTLKYSPGFPQRFANIEQAREFCRTFFSWYNNEHRHSGIALLTPQDVHRRLVDECVAAR